MLTLKQLETLKVSSAASAGAQRKHDKAKLQGAEPSEQNSSRKPYSRHGKWMRRWQGHGACYGASCCEPFTRSSTRTDTYRPDSPHRSFQRQHINWTEFQRGRFSGRGFLRCLHVVR